MPPLPCSSVPSQQCCVRMFPYPASDICLLWQTSSLNCWRAQAGQLQSIHLSVSAKKPSRCLGSSSQCQKVNSSFCLGFLLCPPFTSLTFPVSQENMLEAVEKQQLMVARVQVIPAQPLLLLRGLFGCQYDPWGLIPFQAPLAQQPLIP